MSVFWITEDQLHRLVMMAHDDYLVSAEKLGNEIKRQSTVETKVVFGGKEIPVIWAKTGNRERECAEFICDAILAGATFKSAWEVWENT